MRSQRETPGLFVLPSEPDTAVGSAAVTNRSGSGCRMFRTRILTVLRERVPELRAASHWEIE